MISLDQSHHALAVFDPELLRALPAATSASPSTRPAGMESRVNHASQAMSSSLEMSRQEGTPWQR